jgi:hypothetical protein
MIHRENEIMKMPTNWVLLFSTIVLAIINQGCIPEKQSVNVVNKPWKQSNQLIYTTNGPTVSAPALSSSIKSRNRPYDIDVMILTNPKTGSVWADLPMTFYIDTDSGMEGAQVSLGGALFWKHSHTKRIKERESLAALAARFESSLDSYVKDFDPINSVEDSTDLGEHLKPFYFVTRADGLGQLCELPPKTVSVQGSTLLLEFDNTWNSRATIYIDVNTRKVVKAVEDGKQMFPK